MSPLPQRKKSPEEIAKLRDSLGISASGPQEIEAAREPEAPPVDTIVPANHEASIVHENAPAELPAFTPKRGHSLKRSERIVADSVSQEHTPKPVILPTRGPKPVRSLRKSEQMPATPLPESPPDSPLPHQRHSDAEIEEIRRREVLALMNAKLDPKLVPAHPALIVPGYLSALAAAAGFYFYQFPISATLGCVFLALLVAAFIGIRKPISRHHAAFISVLSLLVLVFGALHYFPYLRHAT